jgi:hypothetical protein
MELLNISFIGKMRELSNKNNLVINDYTLYVGVQIKRRNGRASKV